MTRLTDIPNEILELIFADVSDTDHYTIFNIALINKHLNKVVCSLRVRHWTDGYDVSQGEYNEPRGPPIALFALYLLRHPEFCLRVRSLDFTFPHSCWNNPTVPVPLRRKNLEALSREARETVPELAKSTDLCKDILSGSEFGIAVLVLGWATRLTRLGLSIPCFNQSTIPYEEFLPLRFVKQVAVQHSNDATRSHSLPLGELDYVDFRHNDDSESLGEKYLTPFFHLPKLKHLKTWKIGNDEIYEIKEPITAHAQEHYLMPLPIGTSTVESIFLDEIADISPNELSNIVLACRNSRSFKLEFAHTIIRVSHKALTQILLHHATYLEELDMRFDNNYMLEFNDDFTDEGIFLADCYRHLAKLKSLGMDLEHLLKANHSHRVTGGDIIPGRLPDSLEHLKLYCARIPSRYADNREEMEYCLQGIVTLLGETGPQGRLKNLKVIDARIALFDDPEMEDVSRIKSLAKARGVTFVFRDFNAPEDSDIELSY